MLAAVNMWRVQTAVATVLNYFVVDSYDAFDNPRVVSGDAFVTQVQQGNGTVVVGTTSYLGNGRYQVHLQWGARVKPDRPHRDTCFRRLRTFPSQLA